MSTRRGVLIGLGATLAAPMALRGQELARIVVVGGGFGGATAARWLRRHGLDVTLIEPVARFFTCPFSNLYLGGLRDWDSLGHGYDGLRRAGVKVIHARALDVTDGQVVLDNGDRLGWDRLVLSPGIDMRWDALPGYDRAASASVPHAWQAGAQTRLLWQQLRAMPDGGLFVMTIPEGAYRCPPGPYERAGMVAHYFASEKPRSKMLLLDSKDKFPKQGLFQQGWAALYGDMIEWVGLSDDGQVVQVDAAMKEVTTAFGTHHRADVLNVIPPQKAGAIADAAGVSDASGWVPVHGGTFAAQQVPGIYVLGDAAQASPMPKSGFCANAQGKLVAAAIAADLAGTAPPQASFANTCYSMVGPDYAISVAGVYASDGARIVEIADAGGVSPLDADARFRAAEARFAAGWYASITAEIWGDA